MSCRVLLLSSTALVTPLVLAGCSKGATIAAGPAGAHPVASNDPRDKPGGPVSEGGAAGAIGAVIPSSAADPCVFGAPASLPRLDPRLALPASRIDDLARCVAAGSATAGDLLNGFLTELRTTGSGALPWANNVAYVLYLGDASSLSVSGSFDDWPSPGQRAFRQVAGTELWVAQIPVGRNDRVQYKLTRRNDDGTVTWGSDALNAWVKWDGIDQRGPGSFNAEALGPDHIPVSSLIYRSFIRDRDVYLQLPVAHFTGPSALGVAYLQDGNELLTRAGLQQVVDDVMGRTHQPFAVAYIALPNQALREQDYAYGPGTLGDAYVSTIADEIIPAVESRITTASMPAERAIAGVNSGGLIALYAAWMRNDMFRLVGAESANLDFANEDLVHQIAAGPMRTLKVYLDSSAGSPASAPTQALAGALAAAGYTCAVNTAGAGEDWRFWALRFPALLEYLYP